MKRHWIASSLAFGLLLWVASPAAIQAGATATEADPEEPKGETADTAKSEEDKLAPPEMSPGARLLDEPPSEDWFRPGPVYDQPYSADEQFGIYCTDTDDPRCSRAPFDRPLPLLELGRRVYDRGTYNPRPVWTGIRNPVAYHLMAYGDLRTAVAYNDNGVPGNNPGNPRATHQSTVATRLNLDIDLSLTATERIHLFLRPLDRNGAFTRYDIDGKVESTFSDELDLRIETLYFEGDWGAIRAGRSGRKTNSSGDSNSIDLPFAIGRVPILTQNGVWIEDAFDGVAFSITAKNSPKYDISNFDLLFFAGFNKVTTDAVRDDNDAKVFGIAGFFDAREGYTEFGYAYVHEDREDFSYHNVTAAYSRRFGAFSSSSIRVIGNFGQDPIPGRSKTADGVLLLLENSLTTSKPITLVPYFNLFAGWDTPQSLARAGDAGGVLRNTGINFETDGLTGFPTLDARGHDAYGGALGVEYLFNLDRQLVVEVAGLERHGELGKVQGSEYAIGVRFQEPLNDRWILRFDAMVGTRDKPLNDISGARIEIRRKF